jgi:hypothetical protein
MAHPCIICSTPSTLRCQDCQGAWYCSRTHQRADWGSHRPMCPTMAHMRPCVNCGTRTGSWCDACESSFTEELQCPGARGANVIGRALCTTCDDGVPGICNHCSSQPHPDQGGQPAPEDGTQPRTPPDGSARSRTGAAGQTATGGGSQPHSGTNGHTSAEDRGQMLTNNEAAQAWANAREEAHDAANLARVRIVPAPRTLAKEAYHEECRQKYLQWDPVKFGQLRRGECMVIGCPRKDCGYGSVDPDLILEHFETTGHYDPDVDHVTATRFTPVFAGEHPGHG